MDVVETPWVRFHNLVVTTVYNLLEGNTEDVQLGGNSFL